MKFNDFKNILTREFPGVTPGQLALFERMDSLYREWNAKINVISRKDIDNLYEHHVLHSLGIALYLKYQRPDVFASWGGEALLSEAEGMRQVSTCADVRLNVLDLGCGGGFPGIPLAVLFPKVHFTLCDSIGKKITVAKEVALSLGLENVKTVNARAESLPGSYDYVVSRAVTSLDNFLPWVKGKYRNSVLYLKGGDLAEEIAQAMGRCGLPKGSVSLWPISSVLKDEFFDGKMVIEVKN